MLLGQNLQIDSLHGQRGCLVFDLHVLGSQLPHAVELHYMHACMSLIHFMSLHHDGSIQHCRAAHHPPYPGRNRLHMQESA
jgi:hypothetical protein